MVQEFNGSVLEDFGEIVAFGNVVVDIYAPWCSPCKLMAPTLESISDTLKDIQFHKVNLDAHGYVKDPLKIVGIPTIILYKDGVEADRKAGNARKEDIVSWIISVLDNK